VKGDPKIFYANSPPARRGGLLTGPAGIAAVLFGAGLIGENATAGIGNGAATLAVLTTLTNN
jgi:hypothetical protein